MHETVHININIYITMLSKQKLIQHYDRYLPPEPDGPSCGSDDHFCLDGSIILMSTINPGGEMDD